MANTPEDTLKKLQRLVGSWTTEATHPLRPGVVVHGTSVFEWLEGERFLIQRARTDHPDFPDSCVILGFVERDRVGHSAPTTQGADEPRLTMHYYDSRGVFRAFEASIDERAWYFSREAPGFSQRFTGTFSADGRTLSGLWELCRDDVHWADDLAITYRR